MEFSNLGKHCEICNKQDYLPFEYKCCNKFYCLEHRNLHVCKNIENSENIVKTIKKKKQYKCKECHEKYNKLLLKKCTKCEYKFCYKHIKECNHSCYINCQKRRLKYYEKHNKTNKTCLVN